MQSSLHSVKCISLCKFASITGYVYIFREDHKEALAETADRAVLKRRCRCNNRLGQPKGRVGEGAEGREGEGRGEIPVEQLLEGVTSAALTRTNHVFFQT